MNRLALSMKRGESHDHKTIYCNTPIGIAMKQTIEQMRFTHPELTKMFESKLDESIEQRFLQIQNSYGVESSKPEEEGS